MRSDVRFNVICVLPGIEIFSLLSNIVGVLNKRWVLLEQNIVAKIVCLNKYGHRLTFGMFHYVKYSGKYCVEPSFIH